MIHEYKNRVAVITGAANGLGRALATELASRQCHLALVDIDSSELPNVREQLVRRGVEVTCHCADAGSEQALRHLAGEIEEAHGAVHLLINNAAFVGVYLFCHYSRSGI